MEGFRAFVRCGLFVWMVAALAGCNGGGGGGGGGGSSTGDSTSGTVNCSPSCDITGGSASIRIDETGGTATYTSIEGRDGVSLVLKIPAGALSGSTTLIVAPTDTYPANEDLLPALVFEFGPDGQTFAVPITLTIGYDEAALGSVAEADLLLATVDEDGVWQELDSTVDTDANTITAEIDHFSKKGGKRKDRVAPSIGSVAPPSQSTIQGSASIVVRFTESMKRSSFTVGGDIGSAGSDWSTSNYPRDTVTITPSSAWTEGTGRTLTLDANDVAGNALPTLTLHYDVDSTSPTAGIAPTNNSSIAGGTQIVVTFVEAMDPETLALGGSMNSESDGGSWNDPDYTVLTVSPSGTWSGGAQTLTIGADDKAGNPYAVSLSYTVDTTAPTVTNVDPADEGTLVADADVVITFSKAMDLNTIEVGGDMGADSFTTDLSPGSGDTDVLTLSPDLRWTYGTGKTLTVNGKDLAGNAITQLQVSYDITAASCDDGDACSTGDHYSNTGSCVSDGTLSCDDSNACTVDSCDTVTGCGHAAGNSGAVCRPAAPGGCDIAEQCDGVSDICPQDSFESDTAVCHSASGLCDNTIYCTGNSASCPANQVKDAGTVCRPAVEACDSEEVCDGSSPDCPTDYFQAWGYVCSAPTDCAEEGQCDGGSKYCFPVLATDGLVCNGGAGECQGGMCVE